MADIGILDWIKVITLLGIPMVCLSWIVFRWLYLSGAIDRSADNKVVSARIKEIKQSFKSSTNRQANFLYRKWMWFGSGFYGLAALWTFMVIELGQVAGFLFNPAPTVARMREDATQFAISTAMAQAVNLLESFLWFAWWTDEGESILLWIAIAWLGYWVGNKCARLQVAESHVSTAEQRLVSGVGWLRGRLTRRGEKP